MKAFPWRAGMRDSIGCRVLSVDDRGIPTAWAAIPIGQAIEQVQTAYGRPGYAEEVWSTAKPDPNDGATKGALLEVVREVWGAAFGTGIINVRPYDATRWACYSCNMAMTEPQPSEFAALEAAWQAAP